MQKFIFLLGLAFIISTAVTYGQHTDEINSNRPGKSMSAYAVGKSVIQVETGAYAIYENHNLLGYEGKGYGLDLSLRYGVLREQLELIADVQYQKEDFVNPFSEKTVSGLKQGVLGAKYLLYDPFKNYEKKVNIYSWKANHKFDWHQMIPAVAVYAGANFVMKNNPTLFAPEEMFPYGKDTLIAKISPKIMLVTQNHFGDGSWVFVTNIIADHLATDFPSYGYVLTLTKGISSKWSGFVENQGFKSDLYSDVIFRGGAVFLLSKNIQIDASATTNFKNTPTIFYGGLGLSWRYDAGYKEIRMDLDSGSTSKPSSVRKVERKDQRRRKDAIK